MAACAKANKLPPPGWTAPDKPVESVFSPSTLGLGEGILKHKKKISCMNVITDRNRPRRNPLHRRPHPRLSSVRERLPRVSGPVDPGEQRRVGQLIRPVQRGRLAESVLVELWQASGHGGGDWHRV